MSLARGYSPGGFLPCVIRRITVYLSPSRSRQGSHSDLSFTGTSVDISVGELKALHESGVSGILSSRVVWKLSMIFGIL